jgi:hypothetical protein
MGAFGGEREQHGEHGSELCSHEGADARSPVLARCSFLPVRSAPAATVRRLMATRPARRTRVTIRCVREDLGLDLPSVEVDLGSLDHPLVAEARRVAPAAPRGQKRILAIAQPLVYRIRHGRWRGATWLETDERRFWLCAGALREEGSGEDAYEVFAALHETGRLLPDADDHLRDALERNARIIDAAAAAIPGVLASALARPGRDVATVFGDLVDARLHATAAGDEIWVAIATQAAEGRFVDERLRDVLFRLVFDAAEAELWEPRADWPSGELAWFEVARLGLREPT